MPKQFRRTALLAACSATVLLGLTACSPDAAKPSAAPAASSASSIPAPNAGTAGLPNGDKLSAMLLPADAVPHGLRLDPAGTKSTGNGFNPPGSPEAIPADKVCDRFKTTGWIDVTGLGSASFAQNDYMDDSQNLFGQEIDAFRGNDAQTAMASLNKILTGCHTFKTDMNGQKLPSTVKLEALPGVGDEAIQAVITSPDLEGGVTVVAARVGSMVVTTMFGDQHTTGTAAVAAAKALVKNVAAAH